MKKLVVASLIAGSVFVGSMVESNAINMYDKVQVTVNGLNLRSEPSLNSQIYDKFNRGKNLIVTGRQGNWIQVEDGHIDGWVDIRYIRPVDAGFDNSNKSVTTSRLNVRYGPSTKYRVYRTIRKYDTVSIIGSSNGWYKIGAINNIPLKQPMYVSSAYVK